MEKIVPPLPLRDEGLHSGIGWSREQLTTHLEAERDELAFGEVGWRGMRKQIHG